MVGGVHGGVDSVWIQLISTVKFTFTETSHKSCYFLLKNGWIYNTNMEIQAYIINTFINLEKMGHLTVLLPCAHIANSTIKKNVILQIVSLH